MATQRRWCRVSAKLEHTWWRHSGWVRAGATPRCLPPSVFDAGSSPAVAWACRFGHREHGSPRFVRDSPGLAPRQGRTCSHPRLLLLRGITYRVCAAGRRVHAWKAAMQVRLLRRLQRAGHCRPLWTKHRLRTLATPRSRTYAWYVPRRGSTVPGLAVDPLCVWLWLCVACQTVLEGITELMSDLENTRIPITRQAPLHIHAKCVRLCV